MNTPDPTRRQLLLAASTQATRVALVALVTGTSLPAWANPTPPEVTAELPNAQLRGSGRLRVFGFQIYDARLWSPAATSRAQWRSAPLALELQYLRKFEGTAIAERSLKEMRRQGDIAAATAERWLAELNRLIPDVVPGDRLTGVQLPGEGARFFVNGQLRGEVRDAEFARWFFGIWLSDRTSEPDMRDALLGLTHSPR